MILVPPGPDRMTANRRARNRRTATRLAIGFLVLVTAGTAAKTLSASFETQARENIRIALDENGMEWAEVWVWGRTVQVKGERPALGHGGKALDVVRGARCSFLAIPVSCARSVTADFGDLEPTRPVDRDTAA